jgi:hypothetical protein
MLGRMVRVPLGSQAVAAAGYEGATRTLELEFRSGRVYRFADVPETVYEWLLRVPNKGIYVARSITGQYAYEDVTDPPTTDGPLDLAALLEASLSGGKD